MMMSGLSGTSGRSYFSDISDNGTNLHDVRDTFDAVFRHLDGGAFLTEKKHESVPRSDGVTAPGRPPSTGQEATDSEDGAHL